ncbi:MULTISPECIES: DegV family protein [unclassified Granulicatella]|uniref:DegV family protein n=1 Tax=unclassified Granulicatella TaxID=2630493 RepID=UPI0010737A39|nr:MULTISPECIES: DegV family protein [unclassified Granulicatella]MBF0780500.1 DegV family protein [Granulicatella sp. 19428wC4_WM01]TFU95358.1 DegV family protein [Granulicatella sp. WM01]
MEMKIAIVTDSVAYLSQEECQKSNIYVLPLSIEFDGKVYVEGEDLTPTEFYDLVRGTKNLPKSSQPSVGSALELYQQLSKEYDAAIAIHLSSDISGTYQTAVSLMDEFSPFKIFAVDSKRACGSQSQLVREAVRLTQEGYSPETIVERLSRMIEHQTGYFLVDDLMHLQKGGRLSTGAAVVGSMLNIKPILTINGPITVAEKIRTFKKGITRITELFEQFKTEYDVPFTATIHHANRLEFAKEWQIELQEKFPNDTIEIVEFGPVIGTHLGEKSIGLIFGPTMSE